MSEGLKVAAETETKFQFYVVALIFTILALAIQTSPEEAPRLSRVLELLSWTLLLFAGFLGLTHIERQPKLFRSLLNAHDMEKELARRRASDQQGDRRDVHHFERAVHEANAEVSALFKFKRVSYRWARWLLPFGVLMLAASRGYPLVLEIAG